MLLAPNLAPMLSGHHGWLDSIRTVWYQIPGSRKRLTPAALPIWIPLARRFRLFDAGLSRGTTAALVRYAARAVLGRERQRKFVGGTYETRSGRQPLAKGRRPCSMRCFNGPTDTCSIKLQLHDAQRAQQWPRIVDGWVTGFQCVVCMWVTR